MDEYKTLFKNIKTDWVDTNYSSRYSVSSRYYTTVWYSIYSVVDTMYTTAADAGIWDFCTRTNKAIQKSHIPGAWGLAVQ